MASRLLTALALACAALALAPGATPDAGAAGRQKAKAGPTISFVAPMRVTVGRTIAIRGRGFRARKKRNTVIFQAPNKRTAFAKPIRATKRKLVVRVPNSVERLIVKHADKPVPTRFALRVVAGRYGKLTPRRRSPVILSAIGSPTPPPAGCGPGGDPDRDLLQTALEQRIKTDPCLADTDGDGVEDGFEYQSALDLNQSSSLGGGTPYPGKRPYPNPLDASDAGYDYDGDGLSNGEEFRAWAHPAVAPGAPGLQHYTDSLKAPAFTGPYAGTPLFGGHGSLAPIDPVSTNVVVPLTYSDGLQATLRVTPGHPEYRDLLDHHDRGPQTLPPVLLTDDERDVDGDGLRNLDEIRGLMWERHYPAGVTCGYEYKPVLPRSFLQVDYLDFDSDGDGVWDGDDDQDNDGVSNVDEVRPPYGVCENASPLPINGAQDGSDVLRHPYNPCLPYASSTCAIYGLRE